MFIADLMFNASLAFVGLQVDVEIRVARMWIFPVALE
jgi:hypothetical protein